MSECHACRYGWPPLGTYRCCADCDKPMLNAKSGRRCKACNMRRRRAAGAFNKIGIARGDRWTPEEEGQIRAMAGRFTAAEIAKRIGRSKTAVHNRAHTLGIPLQTEYWSARRIAALFGFRKNETTITKYWLETGLLPGRKTAARQRSLRGQWQVREADLEAFIRDCPWAYDAAKMFPAFDPLVQLARRVQQRDPWVYSDEASRIIDIPQSVLVRWCVAGVIPHKRRHVGRRGGQGGHVIIRAADLEPARIEIEHRREVARATVRDNLLETMRARRAERAA